MYNEDRANVQLRAWNKFNKETRTGLRLIQPLANGNVTKIQNKMKYFGTITLNSP